MKLNGKLKRVETVEIKKLKNKGDTMIERAESQFWAYQIEEDIEKKDLVLLDNVQFIYELFLAELELIDLMDFIYI